MAANTQNPDVRNTAGRYIAKALLRVNPGQRAEMLRQLVIQAQDGLRIIEGSQREAA